MVALERRSTTTITMLWRFLHSAARLACCFTRLNEALRRFQLLFTLD